MKPKITVRLVEKENCFGPGMEELLRCIEQSGSIKNAAAQMGMSYSKALKILNRAEKELDFPLLRRSHGGAHGGQAEVTPEGRKFMETYHRYNQEIQQFAEKTFEDYFPQELMKSKEEKVQ